MNTTHLDGLPGITLQGKSGNIGERGNTTFLNVPLSLRDNELVYNLSFFSDSEIVPIKNDYFLNTNVNTLYLYIVTDADKHTVKLLDTLTKSLYKNISLATTYDIKKISLWEGKLDSNNNYIISSNSASIINTKFILSTNMNLNDIRIELEFKGGDLKVGHVSSCMNTVWGNKNSSLIPNEQKNGIISEYSYKLNFDNEELRDFNIIIKDFNNANSIIDKYIPNEIYNKISVTDNSSTQSYNVYAYAYIKNKTTIEKVFLKNMTEELYNIKEKNQ